MQRPLRFRAWAHASKTMFYPDSEGGWELHNGELTALPNTTLMQNCGLTDKNGKEIYEGDVVQFDNTIQFPRRFYPYPVVWRDASWCIQEMGSWDRLSDFESFHIEIIGNIYENPELLTK